MPTSPSRISHRYLWLTAALLVVATPSTTRAEHGGPALHSFPPDGAELPPNGRVVLISTNGQHPSLPKRGSRGLELRSAGQPSVPLRVVETHDDPDGYGTASAVLVPRRPLVPGATYTLALGAAETGHTFSWTVTNRRDRTRPKWLAPPTVTMLSETDPYLPNTQMTTIAAADDGGPILLRVTFTDRAGKRRTALLDFHDYSHCAFTGYVASGLKAPVRMRLTLVDLAGRTRRARGRTLRLPPDNGAYLCLPRESPTD